MKSFLLILFAALMSFCSCDDDNGQLVGKEIPMVISSGDVKIEPSSKEEGVYYIHIPAEGDSFNLQVNNYDEWEINSVSLKTSENNDFKLVYTGANKDKDIYDKKWYDLQVISNQAKISIFKNTLSIPRTLKVNFISGDAGTIVYIIQAAQ